jgi:hypothetical protein
MEELVRAGLEARLEGRQVDDNVSGVEEDYAFAGNVIGVVEAEHQFHALLER